MLNSSGENETAEKSKGGQVTVPLGQLKSQTLGVKEVDSVFENADTTGEVRIEVETSKKVDFNETAIHEGLSLLTKTARVFIVRNSSDHKRFDVINDMGTVIYRLVDLTKELDQHEINFCLMTEDGKKELLILQGGLGLLGLNGKLVARYPGSLPGDQEKTFGSAVIQSKGCRPTCKLKDSLGEDFLELHDKSKRHVLNPCKKCRAVEYEAVKHGGLVVYGRIEERKPKDLTILTAASSNRSRAISLDTTPYEPSPLPVGLNRKSLGGIPIATVLNTPDKRRTSLSGGSGRRGSIATVKIIKDSDHSVFCIGFKQDSDFHCRALLITAHILMNFEFIGTTRKCTRFACSVAFWVTLLSAILILVIIGVSLALVFTRK